MKRYYITALFSLAAVVAGCKKEGTLTPTEVPNWLEIAEPAATADAVDKKIYDIYKKHGVSVFLTDTIGSEDRGRVDENGDPVYHYEMIDLNYNITQLPPGTDNTMSWAGVEWWNPGQKARALPLLELLDERLIPFLVDNGQKPARTVMIAGLLKRGVVDQYVSRGPGNMALNAGLYYGESSLTGYILPFVSPLIEALDASAFDEYFAVTRQAFSAYAPDIWDGSAHYYDSYFPGFARAYKYVSWLDATAERDLVEGLIAGGDDSAETAGRLTAANDRIALLNLTPAEQADAVADEAACREQYERDRPQHFGILGPYEQVTNLGVFIYMPPSANDLSSFVNALLAMTDAGIEAEYGDFPLVIERFALLKAAFETAGFDLDPLRGE